LIVVDASAFLDVLLRTSVSPMLAGHMFADGQTMHAPHLVDLEVAQVLRRYVSRGDISAARGEQALSDFAAFPVARYPHQPFLPRIWELRANVTAYDAVYLALAETLEVPLLTSDGKLEGVPGHLARIITP
jgi:predicted nucleic acid-binding protein